MKNYYEVEAKCGHVGTKNCIWIKFAVWAEDGRQAAAKARKISRVKHDHKDAIRYVKNISFEEFVVLKAQNDADPFLHCKNIQQQRKIENIIDRTEIDYYNIDRNKRMNKKRECTEYKRKKTAMMIMAAIKEIEMEWAV